MDIATKDEDGYPLKVLPRRLVVSNNYIYAPTPRLQSTECYSYDDHFEVKGDAKNELSEEAKAAMYYDESISSFKPVDSSIGEIEVIAVGYRASNKENERNAFNKIYSDLVIKLGRLIENKNYALSVRTITNTYKSKRQLERINYSLKELAFFTGNYLGGEFALNSDEKKSKKTTFWIQDDFIPLVRGNDVLLTQHDYLGAEENTTAKSLASLSCADGIHCDYRSQYHGQLVGGNIIFLGDYTLVGKYATRDSDNPRLGGEHNFMDEELFKEKLSETLGVNHDKIIIIGQESSIGNGSGEKLGWLYEGQINQATYHLDMCITPFGKRMVTNEEGKTIEKQVVLLGEIKYKHLKKDGVTIEKIKTELDECAALLDKAKCQLEATGEIEVVRIPLPLTYIHHNEYGVWKRTWVLASFNNAIVQYAENENDRYIFLPKYSGTFTDENTGFKYHGDKKIYGGDWSSLKKYEKKVHRKLEQEFGFNVIKLTNYLPLILLRGAAHCITKVLKRKNQEQRTTKE